MRRKGQAALEYLVTYGWAILAILVTVGALSYFGLLNPSRYLPTSCEFGAQLECADYLISEVSNHNGCVLIKLRNNFGDGIRIYDITTLDGNTQLEYGAGLTTCTGATLGTTPYVNISKGNTSDVFAITIDGDSDVLLLAGDRNPIQFVVNYSRNVEGSPFHTLTGEIFATVAGN